MMYKIGDIVTIDPSDPRLKHIGLSRLNRQNRESAIGPITLKITSDGPNYRCLILNFQDSNQCQHWIIPEQLLQSNSLQTKLGL